MTQSTDDDKTEVAAADSDPTRIAAADDDETKLAAGSTDATRIVAADDAATEVASGSDATVLHGRPAESKRDPLAGIQTGTVLKERFRLGEKLGAGAMGAVFRAVDQRRVETRHHNPHVAIKLIAGEFSRDARAFIALQREADKSQTLAHPNIITVYDFDRDGDLFFMTMESLVGATLDSHIAEAGRSAGPGRAVKQQRRQTIAYIGDIANAIAYAHQRNIVHSDLKPQNVFITDEGTLKVLDFGIARAFSELGDAPDDPGEIAGLTPPYASCEMLQGEDPHPADDVYAIGLIAYEMLTGEHPFQRARATEARAQGLKPKRIRGLPAYQWAAIAKALAFERGQRWKNADAFRRKFSGTGRRVRQLSAALLVAISAFGAYTVFYQPAAGPEIPFEQLPVAAQQDFNQYLAEGQTAMQFGDINGALFYLDKAYLVHPRNPRVMAEINGLLNKIFAQMAQQTDPEARARHLAQVTELQKYESLNQNARLVEKRQALTAALE